MLQNTLSKAFGRGINKAMTRQPVECELCGASVSYANRARHRGNEACSLRQQLNEANKKLERAKREANLRLEQAEKKASTQHAHLLELDDKLKHAEHMLLVAETLAAERKDRLNQIHETFLTVQLESVDTLIRGHHQSAAGKPQDWNVDNLVRGATPLFYSTTIRYILRLGYGCTPNANAIFKGIQDALVASATNPLSPMVTVSPRDKLIKLYHNGRPMVNDTLLRDDFSEAACHLYSGVKETFDFGGTTEATYAHCDGVVASPIPLHVVDRKFVEHFKSPVVNPDIRKALLNRGQQRKYITIDSPEMNGSS